VIKEIFFIFPVFFFPDVLPVLQNSRCPDQEIAEVKKKKYQGWLRRRTKYLRTITDEAKHFFKLDIAGNLMIQTVQIKYSRQQM